ncbi:MAG TPA: sugar ABC transporter substrate-binding protein [Spirochaetia bacterium]|nr:sugar ABC transporter substrate-binding protein [Spirochaetia bacterium]
MGMKRMALIAAFMVFALSGAVFAGGNQEGASAAAGGTTNLRVWGWAFTEGPGPATKELIAKFQEKNPNIKVEINSIPWNQAHDQIIVMLQAHSVPDLIGVNRNWLTEFVTSDYLADLTPFVAKVPGLKDKFFPAVRGDLDGKTWIIPWYGGNSALIYDVDAFKKAGLEPPKTLDEFVQDAKKLSDPSQNKFGTIWNLSSANPTGGNVTNIGPILTSFGGQYLRDKKAAFNDAAGVKTLEWMMDLEKRGLAAPGSISVDARAMREKLAGGTVAMTFDGAWGTPFYNNYPNVHIGIAEMPKGTNIGTVINVANWGIAKEAKQKDAAWALLSYFVQDDNLINYYRSANVMPLVPKMAQMPEFQTKYGGFLSTLSDTDNFFQTGSVPQESELYRLVIQAYQEAFLGKKSPKQALDDAAAAYNKILEQFYASK